MIIEIDTKAQSILSYIRAQFAISNGFFSFCFVDRYNLFNLIQLSMHIHGLGISIN